MRLLLVAAFALCACRTVTPAFSVVTPLEETRRTTTQGEVIGGAGKHGSRVWLGIPFAAPPVGELRWRAPQPPTAWAKPLEATHFGHACMQTDNPLTINEAPHDGMLGSEDCLTLNVWAPAGEQRDLPVMVWVHGGGNSIGSAASYDLGHLATAQNIVGVSVQYRMGPLGWFRHAALRDGAAPDDASGNFGTLDLVRALEWVRDNAAAFGGDPKNVTLFGESAGGTNTYAMLVSPRAKGLFHRAIAQSPTLARGTLETAENFADDASTPGHPNSSNEIARRVLGKDKAALAAMNPKDLAAALRSLEPATLYRAYLEGAPQSADMLVMPALFPDGAVLPKTDWHTAFSRADGWNRVPVITGSNRDEAKLFLFLNPKFTRRLFGVIPQVREPAKYDSTSETFTRLWRAWAIDGAAQAMLQSGATDVYSYRFDWAHEPKKGGIDLQQMFGAAHGFEIPFVHGNFEGQIGELLGGIDDPDSLALSATMMAYWAEFARTGKPGAGWAPYEPGGPTALTFDSPADRVKMSSTVESYDTIVADMIKDPRVDLEGKCEGLRRLVEVGFLDSQQYGAITACPHL